MSWSVASTMLLIVILMIVSASTVNGIQCYVCDSTDNPGCTNLKSNSSIVPETCTLEKMKSLNTWLFELNEISYFKSDINNIPPMNCQKVVAKQTPNGELITARFCQLDTRDTNACTILKDKLASSSSSMDNDNGEEEGSILEHCSICSTERCNGSDHLKQNQIILMVIIFSIINSRKKW